MKNNQIRIGLVLFISVLMLPSFYYPSTHITNVGPGSKAMYGVPGVRTSSVVFYDDFDNLNNWASDTPPGMDNDITVSADSSGGTTFVNFRGNGRMSNTEEGGISTNSGVIPAFSAPSQIDFRFTTSDSFEGSDYARLYVSDDDGTTWTKVWEDNTQYNWEWQTKTIDISSYNTNGGQFRIMFWLHCNYKNDNFLVDWVKVTGTTNSPPTMPGDVSPDNSNDKTPHLSWGASTDPDGDSVQYYLRIGTTQGDDDVLSWTGTGSNTYYDIQTALAPYNTYYIQVVAYDGSAPSDIRNDTITIGNLAPNPPTSISPDSTGNRKPQISWDAAIDPDTDDTITEYQIQIGTTSGGSDFLAWTSTGISTIYDVSTQMDFTTYYVQIKAYDGYDWSDVHEEQLVIDAASNSPPNAPESITPDTTYDVTPQISWPEATDPDGDSITDYQIQIGTTSGGSDILSWTSTGGNRYYQVDSALAVGTYYVQVKAYDDNSWSGVKEETMEVLNTPPDPPSTCKVDGLTTPTSVNNKQPSLTWSGASDINSEQTLTYYLKIGNSDDSQIILPWTYLTDALYTFTSPLAPGTYNIHIVTFDGLDNSTTEFSDQFTISNTAPPPPSWIEPDNTTNKYPHITWESVTDADGDSVFYFVQLGTMSSGSDVISWTETTATSLNVNQSLIPGQYYVQVKVSDGYDESIVHEEVMNITNNAPTAPTDIQPRTTSIQMPNITWSESYDPDGDEFTYYIQIGSSSGASDVLSWTDTHANHYYQVTSALPYADYYVQVKADDGYDSSPVTEVVMTIASDANNPPTPPSSLIPQFTNSTTPYLSWSPSTDPDEDAITYDIRAGSGPDLGDIFNWTTVTTPEYQIPDITPLKEGLNYIQIRAYDGKDYSSVYKATVTVDLGVNLPPGPVSDIRPTTTVLTTPTITWKSAVDPNGDTLTYLLRIGITSNGSEVLPWTSVGSNLFYEVEVALDFRVYYVQVKANDGELDGPVTEAQMEIRSTNSPPLPPTMITPAETKERCPTIYWYGASDPDKDELSFSIRLGTTSGAGDILDWADTGTNNFYIRPSSQPLDYGTYYVQVRAFDGSDYSDVFEDTMIISETANSPPNPPNKLKPRSTPQTTPTIYWYGASDPDGDNLTYWLQIGTTPGGSEIMSWTNVSNASYRITRSLDRGTYYVQIMSYDGKQNSSVFETTLDIVLEGNRAPTSPTAIEPQDTYDTTPTISWEGAYDPDDDTLYYWIRIGTTLSGSEIIPWTFVGTDNFYNVQVDLAPGTYYVFILAYDGIDNASMPTGGTMNVLVRNNRLPDGPNTFSPKTTSDTTPTISWSGASDQDGDELSYFLAVGTNHNNTDILNWTYVGNTNNYTFMHNLSVGTYFVMLKAFDGTGNSSVVVNTLRIVPPYTYDFTITLDRESFLAKKTKYYNIKLTVDNTGTGSDTYNISLSGRVAKYAYIKEKLGESSSLALGFQDANRHMTVTIAGGDSRNLTIVVMLPLNTESEDIGILTVTVRSMALNTTETKSVEITVEETPKSASFMNTDMWPFLYILLAIIILIILFFLIKRRKKDDDESGDIKIDDGFSEDFEDIVPVAPTSSAPTKDTSTTHKAASKKKKTGQRKKEVNKPDSQGGLDMDSFDVDDLDSELALMEEKELSEIRKGH